MLRRHATFVTFIVLCSVNMLGDFAVGVMFLRPYKNGILLNVKVRPSAAPRPPRQHTDAAGNSMLIVTVSAPPEHGKANQAVCRLLAEMLGVAPSAVSVERGVSSTQKTLRITGVDAATAAQTLSKLV